MSQVPELTPTEFMRRWPEGAQDPGVVLLDIREPVELAAASLAGARHIRMGEVVSRVGELDAKRPVVVMCHSGARSLRVAAYLLEQGFEHVFNLRGGIDAWSREIDADVPRY